MRKPSDLAASPRERAVPVASDLAKDDWRHRSPCLQGANIKKNLTFMVEVERIAQAQRRHGNREDHPNLVNADAAPPGHDVLLWFQVNDFYLVVERARAPRSSKNLASTLHPGTRRFGSAIPMVMRWWLPVRTVNAVPNLGMAVTLRRLKAAKLCLDAED